MEGSKVSEARCIPAFFDELYRIQDKNHGYGEDGEDGDHDEEFDEGEALMTHYYSILAEMGGRRVMGSAFRAMSEKKKQDAEPHCCAIAQQCGWWKRGCPTGLEPATARATIWCST